MREDALLIDIVRVRDEMGLSKTQFIDLCILLGTDFSGTIQGVGMVRAMEYIKEYGSIEELLLGKGSALKFSDDFDHLLARRVFSTRFDCPIEWHANGRWDRKSVD